MTKVYLVAATLGAAILSATVPAEARGPGGFGGPGGRGGATGALFEHLLFPCRAACLDAGRSCVDSADATAVTCAEGACAAAIDTARTACANDPATDACQDGRGALRECVEPCLTARRTAAGTCRTTVDECLDACDSTASE